MPIIVGTVGSNLSKLSCKSNLAFSALVELYLLTAGRVASHIPLEVHYDAVMCCFFRLLSGHIQKSFRKLGDLPRRTDFTV